MYKAKEFVVERSDEDLNRMVRAVHGVQPEAMILKGITMRIMKTEDRSYAILADTKPSMIAWRSYASTVHLSTLISINIRRYRRPIERQRR